MTNRIIDVSVINHRLDPHETELRVYVEVETLTPGTEIRGRLNGPRCAYSSTIEIAYPLREIVRQGKRLEMRVVIPEASWWKPETPFLYQGPLELWQDGVMCVRQPLSHGTRTIQLTSKGLRLNGQPYELRGRIVEPTITETELQSLHESGINLILTRFRSERDWTINSKLWHWADRIGLFVLCRALDDFDARQFGTIQDVFASAFGCVVPAENAGECSITQFLARQSANNQVLFGVESTQSPIPESTVFMLCTVAELASMHERSIPKIALTDSPAEALPTRPDLIGWIVSAS